MAVDLFQFVLCGFELTLQLRELAGVTFSLRFQVGLVRCRARSRPARHTKPVDRERLRWKSTPARSLIGNRTLLCRRKGLRVRRRHVRRVMVRGSASRLRLLQLSGQAL